jgi:hypothetical protein
VNILSKKMTLPLFSSGGVLLFCFHKDKVKVVSAAESLLEINIKLNDISGGILGKIVEY